VRFFLQGYEHVGDVQLALELGVALHELHVEPLRLRELGLATGLLGRQASCAVGAELGAPGRQLRAVDALTSKQGFQRTTLSARQAGVSLFHETQLVGCAEQPAWPLGHRFHGSAAHAK
jgi:hypothetical protein